MKLHIFLSLSLLFLMVAPGQLKAQTGWKTGIIALPGVHTFFNADDDAALNPPSSKRVLLPGMTGGLMLGYNAGAFGIRLNALYGQQGHRIGLNSITNGLGGTATCHYRGNEFPCTHYTTRLEYFRVPLMFGFQTGGIDPPKTTFSFYVGGQASFLTKANMYDNDVNPVTPTPSNVTSYPDAFELYAPIVYSGVVDFGLDFRLDEALEMNLHVRGEYGVSDIENKSASYRLTEGGSTTEILSYPADRPTTNSVSAGLMIGLTYHLRSRWN